MSATAQLRHGEDGFTLVEMLVVVLLSVVVLFATLQILDAFTYHAARQTRVADADDQVRLMMDDTVGDLRGASVILRANATDLVYTVPETAGTRIERLCVISGDLYHSSSVTALTPAAPAAACSTGTKVASLRSTAKTAFTYDGAASSATPALVKNVGLTFSLDSSYGRRAGSSTLQASAARRSAGGLVAGDPSKLKTTCTASGALLSLGVGLPGTGPWTVTYTDSNGNALGSPTGTTLQIGAGATSVIATITDSLGVTSLIHKDVECA